MTKSELIDAIFKRYPNLSIADLKKVVEVIFGKISDALINKKRVEIRGFGAFSIRNREGHSNKDPRNDRVINIDKRNVVYFRTGKLFHEKLNPSNDI